MSHNTPDSLDRFGSWVWQHLGMLVLIFGFSVLAANLVNIAWPPYLYRGILFIFLLAIATGVALGMLIGAAIPLVRERLTDS